MTTDTLPGPREASLARIVTAMRELGVDEATFAGEEIVSVKLGRAPLPPAKPSVLTPEQKIAKVNSTLYGAAAGSRR